jgi:hypothetical protein
VVCPFTLANDSSDEHPAKKMRTDEPSTNEMYFDRFADEYLYEVFLVSASSSVARLTRGSAAQHSTWKFTFHAPSNKRFFVGLLSFQDYDAAVDSMTKAVSVPVQTDAPSAAARRS